MDVPCFGHRDAVDSLQRLRERMGCRCPIFVVLCWLSFVFGGSSLLFRVYFRGSLAHTEMRVGRFLPPEQIKSTLIVLAVLPKPLTSDAPRARYVRGRWCTIRRNHWWG